MRRRHEAREIVVISTSMDAGESKVKRPWRWQCSGCGYVTNESTGRCHGYCYDETGRSCDAVPCPYCLRLHYWTGSVSLERAHTKRRETDHTPQPEVARVEHRA